MQVVYETLQELGAGGKPVITVFNKQDLLTEKKSFHDFHAEYSIAASARTGEGLEMIRTDIETILRGQKIYVERFYPYDQAGKIGLIRRRGELLEEEYRDDGIFVRAYVTKELYGNI